MTHPGFCMKETSNDATNILRVSFPRESGAIRKGHPLSRT